MDSVQSIIVLHSAFPGDFDISAEGPADDSSDVDYNKPHGSELDTWEGLPKGSLFSVQNPNRNNLKLI